MPGEGATSVKRESDTLIFTRQMAALYQKKNYPGKDIVLEMHYTDVGECYQILLGKDGSHVYTDKSLKATTRIETPVTVWRSIAAGKIRGDEAMMQGLYQVEGDFNLMLRWDTYFGGSQSQEQEAAVPSAQKKTNMNVMLLPLDCPVDNRCNGQALGMPYHHQCMCPSSPYFLPEQKDHL